jgi:hypothetical protein
MVHVQTLFGFREGKSDLAEIVGGHGYLGSF